MMQWDLLVVQNSEGGESMWGLWLEATALILILLRGMGRGLPPRLHIIILPPNNPPTRPGTPTPHVHTHTHTHSSSPSRAHS